MSNKRKSPSLSLVGQWFHSHDDKGGIQRQGQVISSPRHCVYLIRLFSWMDGHETDRVLVTLDKMLAENWTFYPTDEQMNFAYEHRNLRGHADPVVAAA